MNKITVSLEADTRDIAPIVLEVLSLLAASPSTNVVGIRTEEYAVFEFAPTGPPK